MFCAVRFRRNFGHSGHSRIFFDPRQRRGVLGMHRALQPLLSGNRHFWPGRFAGELEFIVESLVDFIFNFLRRAGEAADRASGFGSGCCCAHCSRPVPAGMASITFCSCCFKRQARGRRHPVNCLTFIARWLARPQQCIEHALLCVVIIILLLPDLLWLTYSPEKFIAENLTESGLLLVAQPAARRVVTLTSSNDFVCVVLPGSRNPLLRATHQPDTICHGLRTGLSKPVQAALTSRR